MKNNEQIKISNSNKSHKSFGKLSEEQTTIPRYTIIIQLFKMLICVFSQVYVCTQTCDAHPVMCATFPPANSLNPFVIDVSLELRPMAIQTFSTVLW